MKPTDRCQYNMSFLIIFTYGGMEAELGHFKLALATSRDCASQPKLITTLMY